MAVFDQMRKWFRGKSAEEAEKKRQDEQNEKAAEEALVTLRDANARGEQETTQTEQELVRLQKELEGRKELFSIPKKSPEVARLEALAKSAFVLDKDTDVVELSPADPAEQERLAKEKAEKEAHEQEHLRQDSQGHDIQRGRGYGMGR